MSQEKDNHPEPFPMVIKPIRPTVLRFDTEEAYQEFLKEFWSPTPKDTPELRRLRELYRQHKEAKKRK